MTFYWDIAPLLVACCINFALGIYALVRPGDSLRKTFGALCMALTIWCLCYALSFSSVVLQDKIFWTSLKYIGSGLAPVLWFALALQLTSRAHWLGRTLRLLLGSWVVALWLVVATNQYHMAFWQQFFLESGVIEARTVHGPLFALYVVPTYLMIIASVLCYLDFYRRTPDRYQPRAILMVVAALVPLVADGLQQAGYKLLPQVDQVPLSLVLASMLFGFVVLRYRALEILPIARELVIQNIAAAVIVLNKSRQILELNPFAYGLSKVDAPYDVDLDTAFPEFAGIEIHHGLELELEVPLATGTRWLFFRASEVSESSSRGMVLVGLDITDRKHAERELERRATTDPLTNVYNRRAFFEQAEAEFTRAKRAGENLAVLMIDIDHFKSINDSKGHQAGDEVLKVLAQRTRASLREVDLVARYGGEEFICLLAGDANGVLQSAERLRSAFCGVPIVTNAGDIEITISIGVAFVESLDLPLAETIEKADAALYQSKTGGRNQVTLQPGLMNEYKRVND